MSKHRVPTDHQALLQSLTRDYSSRFPRSLAAQQHASDYLIDGGSHSARLFNPYPFRIQAATGARIRDIDDHDIVDLWQGHYANILGHNPSLVTERLASELSQGQGLHTGHLEEAQASLAALITQTTGAERVRFTTSGTLATMYAIMLATAYTGRNMVAKIGGGWHGANPMSLKGVQRTSQGFNVVDSAGLSDNISDAIAVTRFNDVDALEQLFAEHGDHIACLIFEPCLRSGGFLMASRDFMSAARTLTAKYGAILILDEIISGYRFCASSLASLYGVTPDLATYGKIIGGGMPLAVIAGQESIMSLASRTAAKRVWCNGGTFSAHPMSILAAETILRYLIKHEHEIYPELAQNSDKLRRGIESAFAAESIEVRCTGYATDDLPGGSLASLYFPLDGPVSIKSAEDFEDPSKSDIVLREQALKLGLLLHNVNVVHGLGSLSTCHATPDIQAIVDACSAFAHRLHSCI